MRRTTFLALVAALLFASTAHAADPAEIIRDCADDSTLQGDYTASELRNARSNLPTDIDEYSDCRDVLSRAISAKTATSTPAPTQNDSAAGASGGATGGSSGSGGTSGSETSEPNTRAFTREEEAALAAPSSPADAAAVGSAAEIGDRAVLEEASPRSPGAARLAADVGRNGLPATMIGVLALLGATLLAACLPLLRRGHRGDASQLP